MSWESDITQAVANLTNRLNQITTSAKKIFELPWQNILNPASKIHVSDPLNTSEFITVQQILDASLSYKMNQLISANVSVDENDVTVDSGAEWIINNINHETTSDFVETVDYAETGYTRNDILVGNESNLIIRIIGPETEGISPTPNTPINTVLITVINVTDSTIGYVPPVIVSDLGSQIATSPEKTTIVDNDKVGIADSQDSNKTKHWKWSTIKAYLLEYFRGQIEINASTAMQPSWKGKLIIFTSNCTITVPASLASEYAFEGYTMTGVTVAWAITSPKTWENGTPTATLEKTTVAFFQRGSTNSVILLQ